MTKTQKRIACFLWLSTIISVGWSFSLQRQRPQVRFGVVVDGSSALVDRTRLIYENEISELLRGRYHPIFSAQKRIDGNWDSQQVGAAIERLQADPEVDYIIAFGFISGAQAARMTLTKPVFVPYVFDPYLLEIPIVDKEVAIPGRDTMVTIKTSGLPNYVFIEPGIEVEETIALFRRVVPVQDIAILALAPLLDTPGLKASLKRQLGKKAVDVDLHLVPIGANVEEALAAIPAEVDGVYLGPSLQLSPAQLETLVDGLIDRRLPSFVYWGREFVDLGFMISNSIQKAQRRARQLAFHIEHIILGGKTEDIDIAYRTQTRLTINMATARAIGIMPTFAVLTEADLIDDRITEAATTLSLAGVIREADRVNLDLAAANRAIEAGERTVKLAKSPLLPQVGVLGSISFVDETSGFAAGEQRYYGGAQFSQVIYDEAKYATKDIEKSFQDVRIEQRAELRLDVVLDSSVSYLDVLRTKTLEQIQKNNLSLTRSNLELAQVRVEAGEAGREEVYRWESQIAANRINVLDAMANRNNAEIAVNRVLNRPQNQTFLTEEADLNDPELVTSFRQLGPYIEDPIRYGTFSEYLVQESFIYSPELRQFNALIEARERDILSAKRAFFIPSVDLFANLGGLKVKNAGIEDIAGSLELGGLIWDVQVRAFLPLYLGGALRERKARSEIELEQLRIEKEALKQRVEQRIRTVLYDAAASYASISLAEDATRAAGLNLELVADNYYEGIVGIIDLLDAQNQSLIAEQASATTIFNHLIDLMRVQRAIGRFDYFRSAEERQSFINRLDAFFESKGVGVRPPDSSPTESETQP